MCSLSSLSESLYEGLCDVVGTSEQVSIRRDITDIKEKTFNINLVSGKRKMIISGSYKEGFRLPGSDVDMMFWPEDHKVLSDLSQSEYYSRTHTPILMENNCTQPGFFFLHLLSNQPNKYVHSSCVSMNKGIYISSTLYKENTLSTVIPNFCIHGPCGNTKLGNADYDIAQCFSCDFWPPLAYPWTQRSQMWPSPSVLQDILRDGCHFVAIGSKGSPHEDMEWRISFSLAEQKLVYSMNHCQFLVYGLLKLFLREVINYGVNDKLLCSYFMKSVVFWQIQNTQNCIWDSQNLLVCFWNCFKHIMQWVYTGICPNFFIPENNMFSGKVVGKAQKKLFQQLYILYEKGISCLLQCNSIRSYLTDTFHHFTKCVGENSTASEIQRDSQLWNVIEESNLKTLDISSDETRLFDVVYVINPLRESLTQYQLVYLQTYATSCFHRTAFYLQNIYSSHDHGNKMMYIADKICLGMLHLTARFGYISDLLYLVMYYYRTNRYEKAINLIEMTKVKMAQPYVLCPQFVNVASYNEIGGQKSWLAKMRETVVMTFNSIDIFSYIREMELENNIRQTNQMKQVFTLIDPFIMLHMLSVLCYNHTDIVQRQRALDDLYVSLHYEEKVCKSKTFICIQWLILGICQEICQDFKSAIYSFQKTLKYGNFNIPYLQEATYIRMNHAIHELANVPKILQ